MCPPASKCVRGPCASYSVCFSFIKTPLNFLILHNEKQLRRLWFIHTHIYFIYVFLKHTTVPYASCCVPTHESLKAAITVWMFAFVLQACLICSNGFFCCVFAVGSSCSPSAVKLQRCSHHLLPQRLIPGQFLVIIYIFQYRSISQPDASLILRWWMWRCLPGDTR